jgi:hypothetical protein
LLVDKTIRRLNIWVGNQFENSNFIFLYLRRGAGGLEKIYFKLFTSVYVTVKTTYHVYITKLHKLIISSEIRCCVHWYIVTGVLEKPDASTSRV